MRRLSIALPMLAACVSPDYAGPPPQVTWAVRTLNLRPCVEVASDPLPERQRVVARANALAARPPAALALRV